MAEEFAKEQERLAEEQQALRQRAVQMRLEEEERARKQEEFRQQTEAILAEQEARAAEKMRKLEEEEQIRQEVMERKRVERARLMAEKREKTRIRTQEALEASERVRSAPVLRPSPTAADSLPRLADHPEEARRVHRARGQGRGAPASAPRKDDAATRGRAQAAGGERRATPAQPGPG